jgi:antitoxin component YwqK of YwqJK toxin-antitoxin module
MKFRLILILATAFLVSCSSTKEVERNLSSNNKENGITKEFYEDGGVKYEWRYENNELNGITKEFYEAGKYAEWEYKNDTLIGGKSYFKSGKVAQIHTFENGLRVGESFRYYETGEKETIWEFNNDTLLTGIGYYITGEKKFDYNYIDGITSGISVEYFKTGEKKIEWKYLDGQLNGISKESYKDGTYSEWVYEKDLLIEGRSYYKSGKLSLEYTFKNGLKEGKTIRYYESGKKATVWKYKNDILGSDKRNKTK